MPTDPVPAPADDSSTDPVDITDGVSMTPAAHEATAQVEAAGQAAPVAPPEDDSPATDFIGTRRLTDDDTGSKMTMA